MAEISQRSSRHETLTSFTEAPGDQCTLLFIYPERAIARDEDEAPQSLRKSRIAANSGLQDRPPSVIRCNKLTFPATPGISYNLTTGHLVSPIVAAALCVKPRGTLTLTQAVTVDAFKASSTEFAIMRALAMRFRSLLRGGDVEKLETWLHDAQHSTVYGIRRFAQTLTLDLAAVRNAITKRWSNGQVEGQINRLKMLKRAMYGRAGVDLLRARMMPFKTAISHPD
ncbi:MAG: ISL3 family transposase [Janthinobacterium lividum]